MIAHRLSTITNADQILVVNEGKLVESGSHEQLLEKKGQYANMWEYYTQSLDWKITKEAV